MTTKALKRQRPKIDHKKVFLGELMFISVDPIKGMK